MLLFVLLCGGAGWGCAGVWLFGAWSDRRGSGGGAVAGVGVLFEICIVDASIFVADHAAISLWVVGWLIVLSFCVASYEGHMVDALASRADEGRSSLR